MSLAPDLDWEHRPRHAVMEIVHAVRPCEVKDPTGHRCTEPADWILKVSCGCSVLVCDGCRPMVVEARGAVKLMCHIGLRGCPSCGHCQRTTCWGSDRWEPLT